MKHDFITGERVQFFVDAGHWTGRLWPEHAFEPFFVRRGGWRIARVLSPRDPNHADAMVLVDRAGRVWRMVCPSCVRRPHRRAPIGVAA